MNSKKNDMQLPSNCTKLTLEEMMQNESGWYVNFKTGELFITYKDINSTINWVSSFLDNLGSEAQADEITKEIKRLRRKGTVTRSQGDLSGGIGIRVNEEGFRMFALTEAELEAANSNTLVF